MRPAYIEITKEDEITWYMTNNAPVEIAVLLTSYDPEDSWSDSVFIRPGERQLMFFYPDILAAGPRYPIQQLTNPIRSALDYIDEVNRDD